MNAYQNLEKVFRRYANLKHLESMAHWDAAVMMPEGSGPARADALAELGQILNESLKQPEIGDWLAEAEAKTAGLNDWEKANLREMKRVWSKTVCLSSDLVRRKTLAASKCELAWRKLRPANNWKEFLPLFEDVVSLAREESLQRAQATGKSPYDSMMDLFEPGLQTQTLDPLFADLKVFLKDLLPQVLEKQKREKVLRPDRAFPIPKQQELCMKTVRAMGFDFNRGRVDISTHPFCGGVPQDVRMTTRYKEDNFLDSFTSVIHETGHASYEQGLPREWLSQPVGDARSLGIHESQSLLFEMQLALSPEFFGFVAPMIRETFAQTHDPEEMWQTENLYKLCTRVQPGYIRVMADEVTYPLHVILRYEIEKEIIGNRIEARDIPELWNEKMQGYLGLSTKGNDKDGCMQDIHWTDGTFGYFPTYTLGAMNAAQLFRKANADVGGLKASLARGDFEPLRSWLREKIWSKGSLLSVDELMVQATGEKLNVGHFKAHLKQRYLAD